MRKRPWIIAAGTSACCLLLLAAPSPLASKVLAGFSAHLGVASPAEATPITDQDPSAAVGSGTSPVQPDASNDTPPATVLDGRKARGILGIEVRSATDEDMGRIVDVIVDRTGTTRAAVIDFGGFLGVGSRKIAVDWNAMRFADRKDVVLDMTRDQVKAAPEYQPGRKFIVVLGAAPEFARSRVTERTPEQ